MTIAAGSMDRPDAARERRWRGVQAASGLAFGAFTLLALHALRLRRDASLPGGPLGLLVPVAAGTALLALALLAFGGRLFPIADPTQNPYARMWERYGVSLE